MISAKAHPVRERINQFAKDFDILFNEAVANTRQEIRDHETREATDRLYGPSSALSKFQTIKVNKGNAKTISSIFKLMETYDGIKAAEKDAIVSRGKERGFTEEESLCIYNMRRYALALDNLNSQKTQMVEIVLAED
jgi:hypothetical protein